MLSAGTGQHPYLTEDECNKIFAAALNSPLTVVPVAVNSGLFWGRRSFLKRPGTIVIEMLPPLPRGLDRRGFADG